MNKYYELIANRQKADENIKQEKERLHKQFFRLHRQQFKPLDIAVVIIFLLNFSAAFLTTMLVEKEAADTGEPMTYYEANPVAAEMHDYVVHPESESLVRALFITIRRDVRYGLHCQCLHDGLRL